MPKHHSDRYYQLPISRDNIHFLGTVEDLQQCRELVFKVQLPHTKIYTELDRNINNVSLFFSPFFLNGRVKYQRNAVTLQSV